MTNTRRLAERQKVISVFGPRFDAQRQPFADEEAIYDILSDFRDKHAAVYHNQELCFITGGSKGVELIAEQWCGREGIRHERIKPVKDIIDTFGYRNEQIILSSDELIVFWDNACIDTSRLIRQAVQRGRLVHIVPVS